MQGLQFEPQPPPKKRIQIVSVFFFLFFLFYKISKKIYEIFLAQYLFLKVKTNSPMVFNFDPFEHLIHRIPIHGSTTNTQLVVMHKYMNQCHPS